MNRRSYPNGQSKSLIAKALLLYLDAVKGSAVADGWLKSIHMVRDDLHDETRAIPLTSLLEALRRFSVVASTEEIAQTWKYFASPATLGAWMQVLRGATNPADALAHLDKSDGEYNRTMRWETIEVTESSWRGRVHVTHDPELEKDGLLLAARLAELSAVPSLFGLGRATSVVCNPNVEPTGAYQEFVVQWRHPKTSWVSLMGAFAGGMLATLLIIVHRTLLAWDFLVVFFGATLGGTLGILWVRERIRRAEAAAQTTRVHALERSMALREEREHASVGSLEGTVVAGQYRIKEQMGAGASGVIYEATRITDGLPVALKLLRVAAAHDVTASDRLRREAEALGLAWHPNVVEVIDQGLLQDGTAYLVMELLHGESLHMRLKEKGRMDETEVLMVATQVSDALVAVHAAGIVHRDLKPSNIFLSINSDRPEDPIAVKVLDFGIARVEWEETRITNIGSPLGTPGYMSPEQELGGDIDARSDIYSLGTVLYECFVGEAPPPRAASGITLTYPGLPTGSASSFDHNDNRFTNLVPPRWQAIIAKAMASHPADRFQDARAFGLAIRALEPARGDNIAKG